MAKAEQAGPVTIGYWNIRGLGAPLRMMVMYSGAPLHCDLWELKPKPEGGYDPSAWLTKKAELKRTNPLINLPYVIDGDLLIAQSNACLAYLGRKLGLWGDTLGDSIHCEELLCEVMDLRNKMSGFAYSGVSASVVPSAAKSLLDAVSSPGPFGILPKLELCLARNQAAGQGTFFVGSHATAPDFHIWEMLDQYSVLAAHFNLDNPLAQYPLLAAFHDKFAALPDNAKYLASPLHRKLPLNNKSAVFGSDVSGGTFKLGQAYDWADIPADY